MSAWHDIKRVLNAAPPHPPSCLRFVLVGVSAEKSIAAAIATDTVPGFAMHDIDGCQVLRAPEGIRGWTVRDRDARGQWFDLDGRPDTHPEFDSTPLVRLDRAS